MVYLLAALALLPLALAETHRLKLHKLPATIPNPELESLYLADKYGATVQPEQIPLISSPSRPVYKDGQPIYWTQDDLKGGHKVPLSSTFSFFFPSPQPHLIPNRLYERSVLL
jgi:saccharopepsin